MLAPTVVRAEFNTDIPIRSSASVTLPALIVESLPRPSIHQNGTGCYTWKYDKPLQYEESNPQTTQRGELRSQLQ